MASKETPVEFPKVPLADFVLQAADLLDSFPALIDGRTGLTWSYTELKGYVRRIASGLARQGVRRGDVVAIYSGNCIEYVALFHAISSLGAITTTISPAFTTDELTYQLEDSGAKYILVQSYFLQRLKKVEKSKIIIKKVFVIGESDEHTTVGELMQDDGLALPPHVPIDPEKDVVAILYSSGTTGLPKGCMLTHYNVTSLMFCYKLNNDNVAAELEARGEELPFVNPLDEATLGILPFYHSYAMIVLMCLTLAIGIKLVVLPKFKPVSFLEAIEKYKITYLPLVPPLMVFLAKSPLVSRYDLSSVRQIGSGAAPLSKDIEMAVKERLGVERLTQGYGMTETTTGALAPPPGIDRPPGAAGKVLAGNEVTVRDLDDGRILGENQEGELWIRGPIVMSGYWNKSKQTAETIDKEGWLHTGDIGYFDKDGWFFIVDRIKELIKYNALQVAPAELEAILITHPGISDVAVIGIPDESAGELPKAYVVLRPGTKLEASNISSFLSSKVAPYKQLRGGVEFIDEIPRNATGKILRRVLKQQSKSHQSRL
ncbi:unnamed protein product [Owenia fusiformis]|uniref:Luciferin 4-monooxygenase n=1 Tax=Owenia fusiformis TaxID=6347 RepID=A0A8S4NYB9_OWEFU|nr:unnamed protein product [Owenia fusiformis]